VSRAQLYQHRAREMFSRALTRLHAELAMGSARRHLDNLVELAESYLDQLTDTTAKPPLVEQLATLRAMVATRHNLRLVKGHSPHAND
jgi:hypothetical protein